MGGEEVIDLHFSYHRNKTSRNAWYCGGKMSYDWVGTTPTCNSLTSRELVCSGSLVCSLQWEDVKFIVHAPQLMKGLWVKNQGKPKTMGKLGDMINWKLMVSQWSASNWSTRGTVLWVTGPVDEGEPSTVSISIGADVFLPWMLLLWANYVHKVSSSPRVQHRRAGDFTALRDKLNKDDKIR